MSNDSSPKPINPLALAPADAARLLTRAGGQPISVEILGEAQIAALRDNFATKIG